MCGARRQWRRVRRGREGDWGELAGERPRIVVRHVGLGFKLFCGSAMCVRV